MATPAEPRSNKRVLALVKAFLKAGIMTEPGQVEDTDTGANVETVREEAAAVLEPMGLRLSQAKTQIVQMQDGFDFLGFCIIWKRKRGTDKWYVYTFIVDKPVQSLQRKIRSLTHRLSHGDPTTIAYPLVAGWTARPRQARGSSPGAGSTWSPLVV